MGTSQVKVNAKATGRHEKSVNRAKEGKIIAEQRKEEAEQIKKRIEARAAFKKQYDSLKSLQIDTMHLNAIELDSLQLSAIHQDSLLQFQPIFTKEDSLALANEILTQTGFEEYRELLEEAIVPDAPKLSNADSIALAKARAVLEEHARSFMPDELGEAANPLEGLFENPKEGGIPKVNGGVPAVKKPSKPNPNIIAPQQAQKLFEKVDPQQFADIQTKVNGLKKKYVYVPDSRFPEEGKKRNKLEESFWKRIDITGNVNISSTDPFIMDFDIQAGYWINAHWLSGVGLIVREQFGPKDSVQVASGDGYGFNVFLQRNIQKGFFGRMQLESQISKSLFEEEKPTEIGWEYAYLVGIGKNFKVLSVPMNSMIMYDLNYKNNRINSGPFVFKIGVRLTRMPGG